MADPKIVETNESVETNDLLEFDNENPKLGNEIIKIYMDTINSDGLTFKVISRPNLENQVPPEYISYVCRNIGRFMVDSIKFLSIDGKSDT